MKRIVLLSIVMFVLLGAKAQQSASEPILEDGKAWKWQHVSAFGEDENYVFMVKVIGDTVIEGRKCKLMESSTIMYMSELNNSHVFAACEEDGKIYEYIKQYNFFYPVLDMSLRVGDKVSILDMNGAPMDDAFNRVVCEDYIEVFGKTRRRLQLSRRNDDDDVDPKLYWVEGIGFNNDLSRLTDYPVPGGWYRYEMLECYKDGELIFTREDFDAEPCTVADVLVESERTGIYDLKGIKHDRAVKGLNIINGKLTFCR